jgi:hypothetical protein
LKDVFETYGEMLNMWCYPTDIEEFEHACLMLLEYALGEDVTPDIQDEVRFLVTSFELAYRSKN